MGQDGAVDTQPPATPQREGISGATALRGQLVEHLRRSGVLHDPEVERALRKVPRHVFLPQVSLQQAYADVAVPTHWENEAPVSSASQPAMVAIMLEQLQLRRDMRVLEIGAGTGYNAALIAELVGPQGSVTTLDIDPEIVASARQHLDETGYAHVHAVAMDGSDGYPRHAPYDRIILTVGAADVAPAWFDQLKDGGILVIPLWLGGPEASVAFRKDGSRLVSESLSPCGFMRLRGSGASGEEWATLPDGRQIFADHARRIAPEVHALLHTRPRRRLRIRPDNGLLQRLGLHGCTLVAIYPARKPRGGQQKARRIRGHWGILARDAEGPSLALFATLLPVLLIFGGSAAEQEIERALARETTQRILPLEQWKVIAYPCVPASGSPPDALHVERPHFSFDVWMSDTQPPAR